MTGRTRLITRSALTLFAFVVSAPSTQPAEPPAGTRQALIDENTPLHSYFKEEPRDALVHQLEVTSSSGTDASSPLRRHHRWLPDPGIVLLENELVNTSKRIGKVHPIPLAEWAFRVADPEEGPRYQLLSHREDTWYGSTYWTGPDWTRVGRDWQHPGQDTTSVRRFTAPRDGKVAISGRVSKAHLDGDGVRLFIRHNARNLWQAEIDGKDSKGLEPRMTLDVHKGDALRFIVHKRGQIFCDTTYWDPVVIYAGGQEFRASKAFAAPNRVPTAGSTKWRRTPRPRRTHQPCIPLARTSAYAQSQFGRASPWCSPKKTVYLSLWLPMARIEAASSWRSCPVDHGSSAFRQVRTAACVPIFTSPAAQPSWS